jgi:hypothetical protein
MSSMSGWMPSSARPDWQPGPTSVLPLSYRIQFERSGRVSLRRKRYDFMGEADPKAATKWGIISYHPDLEEAERRLRHVTSANVYYDKRGQVTHAPAEPEEWGVPDDEE